MIAAHLRRLEWWDEAKVREPYDEWCPGVPTYKEYASGIREYGWVLSVTFYQWVGACQHTGRNIRSM